MPRRYKNKKHNRRGSGHGRGQEPERPNGVPTVVSATVPASRAPLHRYPHRNAEFDEVIQEWARSPTAQDANGGGNVNRGRGHRGGGPSKSRSDTGTPLRGTDSPRRGAFTPRGMGAGRGQGRGRGRGWGRDNGGDHFSASPRPYLGAKARTVVGKDAPLSDLLYAERPLLRPIKFVPSTLTPFLFHQSEEVLKPASSQAADTTESSHVPTADRVARLFRVNVPDPDLESVGQDALEEIDFADLAKFRAEIDAIAQGTAMMGQNADDDQEEIEEVDFANSVAMRTSAAEPQATSRHEITPEAFAGVYNQIKDTAQVSSARDVADTDLPYGVQRAASLSVSPTLDDSLDSKSSIKISNLSNHESFPYTRDAIVVEEEMPHSPIPSLNVSTREPSLSTASSSHSIPAPLGDTRRHHDVLPHNDPLFVVDTTPTRPFTARSASDVILVDRANHGGALGDQDEELIVYVAPHPRSGRASLIPAIPRVELPQTSMLTGKSLERTGGPRSPVREDDASPVPASDRDRIMHPGSEREAGEDYLSLASLTLEPAISASTSTSSPAQPLRTNMALRARKKVRPQHQRQPRNKRGQIAFETFGLMLSEARLREEDVKEGRHPKWEMRRKDDSDVDWGTEDEDDEGENEEDGLDAVSNSVGGMEIDPDLDMNIDAMQGFLKSMSAEGSQFVTMDDIEDEARMRQEDEEGDGGPEGSSDSEHSDDDDDDDDDEVEEEEEEEDEDEVVVGEEEERVFNVEENTFIAKSKVNEELELSEDSDDELSPRSSFQARLRKMRERSRGRHPEMNQETPNDEDNKDIFHSLPFARNVDDKDIKDLLEEYSQIPAGRSRKEKKASFHNLHQGYMDEWNVEGQLDDPEFTTPVNKMKGKKGKCKQATGYFAAELEAQWAKDRTKKAEHKLQRKTARSLAALNRLDPSAAFFIAPGVIVDMVSLESQVRRFVEKKRWESMVLPPMNDKMRKKVHEMGHAFGLRSVSQGDGNKRYTTLFKTGDKVKEGKVKALMKRHRGGKFGGGNGNGNGRRANGAHMPRNREGDEVGREAPKIGENNVGFRMLASMGWSDGDRIGGTESAGIKAPLTAVFRKSKLGLGATL